MLDARIVELAQAQDDLLATWQLVGWPEDQIRHRTAGLERVHDGVMRLGRSPLSARQHWRAATLTTPHSVLSHASAGACCAIWHHPYITQIITRPGTGGPLRIGTLLVLHSRRLGPDDVTHADGFPRTTVERTLIDLAPQLTERQLRKAFREALRLRLTTAAAMLSALNRHPGRRGTARLRISAARYARLPIDRCKSDAEAYALELLDTHRRPLPLVNETPAEEEADQYFAPQRLVIEIDGPAFHRLKDDDARKTAAWRRAGLTVRRIPSGEVFDHPERYLALAPPGRPKRRRT